MPGNSEKTQRQDAGSATLAMVLLRTPSLPEEQQLLAAGITVEKVDASAIQLSVDGSPVSVGLIPAPVPWSNLEGPCATAWWWPEAEERCRAASAHALVFLRDDKLDVFERNLRVTKATAALLRAVPDSIGVYWGAGTLVQSREDFIKQAARASREYLPLYSWVDFRVATRNDGSRFYATTGLGALGLMEIETASRRHPPEVIGLVFNVAHYLCDHGLVLKDGDTIGLTATDKTRVRHRASAWDRSGPVLWLEVD